MEKEFVFAHQAVALFHLGFNEPCLKYLWISKPISEWFSNSTNDRSKIFGLQKEFSVGEKIFTITVPTYSQVFKWFRNNHSLEGWVVPYNGIDEKFYTFLIEGDDLEDEENPDFDHHYEAESACIDKMIEIVKKRNHDK
jgi:hypothetical protein